jgi:hypothetical protein
MLSLIAFSYFVGIHVAYLKLRKPQVNRFLSAFIISVLCSTVASSFSWYWLLCLIYATLFANIEQSYTVAILRGYGEEATRTRYARIGHLSPKTKTIIIKITNEVRRFLGSPDTI